MSQPLITDFNTAKIFIGDNLYKTATYTNSTGSEVTLAAGRLMGRVMATNKVLPHTLTATDGSEQPRFILADSYTVANGDSVTVSFCTAGKIAKDQVTLNSGDTWASILDEYATSPATDYDRAGTIEDLLEANSHISLISATDLTATDND